MLSRSVKFCFDGFARKTPIALVLAASLVSATARATITVAGSDSSNDLLSNVQGNNAYYPAAPTGAVPGGFLLPDTTTPPAVLDLTSVTGSTDPTQAMVFNVNSNVTGVTVPAGFQLLLMAFSSSNSGLYAVPISWANASIGIGGNGSLVDCVQSGTVISPCTMGYNIGGTYYAYAIDLYNGDAAPQIPTPLGAYQIGIYPADVCKGIASGVAPTFCTGGKPQTVPGGTAQMTLTFAFVLVSDTDTTFFNVSPATNTLSAIVFGNPQGLTAVPGTGSGTPAAGAALTVDSQLINVYFQTQASQMSCFSTNSTNSGAIDGAYTPGDNQIFVDLTKIGLNTSAGTVAPAASLIVVGNEADGPTVSGSGAFTGTTPPAQPNLTTASQMGTFAVNDVISGANFFPGSNLQPVSNITNSDQTTSHFYNLEVLYRDAAGFVAYPGTSGTCYLPGGSSNNFVRASAINGALTKSQCFIATAAFRSGDEAPVLMLRHFRDTVLLHTTLGREFVRLYYHYSPPAAYWLIDHPAFRIPVLLALVPVQAIAWLCLRPFLFGILSVLSAFLLLAALAFSRGHFSGRNRGGAI